MLKSIHFLIKNNILYILDLFYPLFKKVMPLHTFRYLACGGANTSFNIILYYLFYNFILQKESLNILSFKLTAHIASFWMAFFITFPIGFYLSMFVVFNGSFLKREIQFFRYFLVILTCVIFNYTFLKIFVEKFNWYPPIAAALSTLMIVTFSYLSQRYFSFKGNNSI